MVERRAHVPALHAGFDVRRSSHNPWALLIVSVALIANVWMFVSSSHRHEAAQPLRRSRADEVHLRLVGPRSLASDETKELIAARLGTAHRAGGGGSSLRIADRFPLWEPVWGGSFSFCRAVLAETRTSTRRDDSLTRTRYRSATRLSHVNAVPYVGQPRPESR